MFSWAQIALVKIINIFTVHHICYASAYVLQQRRASQHLVRADVLCESCGSAKVFLMRIYMFLLLHLLLSKTCMPDSFPIFTVIWKSFPYEIK